MAPPATRHARACRTMGCSTAPLPLDGRNPHRRLSRARCTLGGTLGPRSMAETALMEQWALWAATAVETPALEIMMSPAGEMGEATLSVSAEKLRRPLARLNTHLQGRDWLVGKGATIADIDIYGIAAYAGQAGIDLQPYGNVRKWFARVEALPGFKGVSDCLPQASVKPRLPWPLLSQRLVYAVAPSRGVPCGVQGRSPAQASACW